MTCELVTAISLATTNAKPVTRVRRVCLAALLERASRQGIIVVDFRHKKLILPGRRGSTELLEVIR